MDQWLEFHQSFPTVAFNYKGFDGKLSNRENGFRHIVQCEPWTNMPQNWDLDTLRRYDTVLTFNYKFFHQYKSLLNMRMIRGVPAFNGDIYHLENWPGFDERIPGACILNNYYNMGTPGDITNLRMEILQNLDPNIIRHVWCARKWGGVYHAGTVEAPIHHSHIDHLKKISEYRFSICFESTYHQLWSNGFVTERMFNCFKAKTIPIYIGCYNIEEYVPRGLFIDFRDYFSFSFRDYDRLSRDILSFSKNQWTDMTEKAFEWQKTNRIGNVEDLRTILKELK